MNSHRQNAGWPGPLIAAVLTGAVMLLAGCASLDPAGDIEQASAFVTERSGAETGWTSPWDQPAEQWDGRSPLSSDTAVRVALRNNRAIRRAVETIAASRADFVQAHLLPNPVINVAVGITTDGGGGDPLTAAAVQQLAWIWTRPAAIDDAEARLRAQVLAVSDAALQLVADVRRTHADVRFAERAVALQDENIQLLERSMALLRARLDVGEATRLDLNRVEFDVRASKVDLVDRRTTLHTQQRRLLELLGRADAGTDWRADAPEPSAIAAIDALDEREVMRLTTVQRLDVAAAEAIVHARAAGVNLQDRGRIPDVSAGAGFQQNFSNRRGVFPSIQITPKLFDDNSARIAKAESELRQAVIEADRVRQAAVAEARLAWVELGAQREIVRLYDQDILSLAESNMELARQAFEAGETDLTVLLEAQRRLNDTRIELLDRRRAAAVLVIDLERAVGGSLRPVPPLDETLAATATDDAGRGSRSETRP